MARSYRARRKFKSPWQGYRFATLTNRRMARNRFLKEFGLTKESRGPDGLARHLRGARLLQIKR